MTWIIGNGSGLGYGTLIGDTRVVWPDGTTHDCLQKIHGVARNMVAGFAGDVVLGMWLLEDMRTFFGTRAWDTRHAAEAWRNRAKHQLTTDGYRRFRASVILAGTGEYLRENTIWPDSYCVVMRPPEFVPELFKAPQWTSIGTGSAHPQALAFATQSLDGYYNGSARMEYVRPGGTAMSIASQVTIHLLRQPMPTVGPVIQFGCAFIDHVEVKTCQLDGTGDLVFRPVEPTGLATSWQEFERWARERGLSAHAAGV